MDVPTLKNVVVQKLPDLGPTESPLKPKSFGGRHKTDARLQENDPNASAVIKRVEDATEAKARRHMRVEHRGTDLALEQSGGYTEKI